MVKSMRGTCGEDEYFSHLAQEQWTVMSDDVILVGHEISKPCYFMPVYTHASL